MVTIKHNPPPLQARQYRTLWLESEDQLGLIAECLSEALDWFQTEQQPLPDPLALAEAAAERIIELEAQLVYATLTTAAQSDMRHLAFSTN